MKEYRHVVDGDEVSIKVAEREEDLEGFRDFVRGNLKALGVDSETTGLDTYSDGFQLRLIQFGNTEESWVLPVERGGQFAEDACKALLGVSKLVFQNASYDLQVFDRHLGVPMEKLWPKVLDTRILAHLVDPRGQEEGGIGQGLEALTAHYIDEAVAEEVKGLMTRLAKKYKTTKAKIWRLVDLFDPEYNLYSGMDPILAARLSRKLLPLVPESARSLVPYEHEIAEICSYMERTGFLLDEDYTRGLSERLGEEEEKWSAVALSEFGIESVNSTEQVADALEAVGIRISGRTPSGKRKVDKKVLEELLQDEGSDGARIAKAVQEAKKARKWRTTWADGFLSGMDGEGRCHASINALRARTARMSITGIPAQTLPSGDWIIRRCFIADEGHSIASVDYQAQELRVLAALSGDETMIRAFANGEDLHLLTARAAFGEHIQKDSVERNKYAKTANFQKVYGGGPKGLARDLGIPLEVAQKVHQGFDKAYPGVQRLNKQLMGESSRNGYITTNTGRRLPVDPDRAYSALNYLIQSSSRDVTGRGLIRLHRAGFTPYLRLPVHDEVLASVPTARAEWGAGEIGRLMAEQMGPVFIGTDPEVGKRSWGSLYGADE